MPFTRRGRRRRALAQPFPESWRQLVERNVAHWSMLDDGERRRLEDFIRLLLVDKYWEGSQGFQLTEEIRVVISAMAGLLILGLDYDYYHRVTGIVVAPTTMTFDGEHDAGDGIYTDEPEHLLGLAQFNGPVLIAWDTARNEGRHPTRGHNVVFHEFAHKLDMLDGDADGEPPLGSAGAHRRWIEVCDAEHRLLRRGQGGDLLDPYGATDPAEFFAVATEVFFNRPVEMEAVKPALYEVLRDFYRQDPAARTRRSRGAIPQG
jgi:Mlc titration factor MtfA (ptsG expression regulator)